MQQLTGILLADAMYTVEGVTAALGIGREAQREARLCGELKSVRFGRRVYYRGRDVIAWMESGANGGIDEATPQPQVGGSC